MFPIVTEIDKLVAQIPSEKSRWYLRITALTPFEIWLTLIHGRKMSLELKTVGRI